MPRSISTDRELFALKPETARYERAVSKARGLSILVYPNGCKTFVVRYAAPNGARRRLVLGDYPGLGLADARLKAGGLRIDIAGGQDPGAERAAQLREARMGETLEALADGYWKAAALGLHGGRRRPLRPDTLNRQRQLWVRHVKPALGARRFKELRRADIRVFMEGFVKTGGLSAASIASIGDVVRALFAYALHNDLVEANPAIGLTKPVATTSRTRMFSDAALAKIVMALDDAAGATDGREDPYARLEPNMALGLQLLILTLTRRTECAGGRWPEVDRAAKTWTIPGTRTKNGKAHVIPLSPQALGVLAKAKRLPGASEDGFIFPSPHDPKAHLDPHAMTRAVNRLCVRLEIPLGSPHDIRRTGATTLTGERYGVRQFIVSKVLAHTAHEGAAVTSVYDRNEYLADKRIALDAWGRHIDSLRAPTGGAGAKRKGRPHLRLVSAA